MSKKSVYDERAELIDAGFLGELSAEAAGRLADIDAELKRLDAPRVAEARLRKVAEVQALDREISDLKAKIKMEENASRRPQTKTAGSH